MNQLIQSIIFAVMGAVVTVVSIVENTGLEITVLGALILVVAICGIIMAITDKKKKGEDK